MKEDAEVEVRGFGGRREECGVRASGGSIENELCFNKQWGNATNLCNLWENTNLSSFLNEFSSKGLLFWRTKKSRQR